MKYAYIIFTALIILPFVHAQAIPSTGASLRVDLAKYDPFPAEAGNIINVWIKAENTGVGEAPNATFTLFPKYPFTIVDNDAVKNYGKINGKESIVLQWRLLVDKSAPNGTADFDVIYTIGGPSTSKKTFNITVAKSKSVYELHAIYVGLKPVAYPGSTATLSTDIANIASGTAYYVIAKAESDAAIIETNEIFVGTLLPNDYDTVDFELEFRKDIAPGTYPVKITMLYKDANNIVLQNSNVVDVIVIPEKDAVEQQPLPVATIAIYLILLLLIVKFVLMPLIKHYRKKK
ncbi:MAG TPA: hypothetical protein VI968_02440 [archaeon]|nr:hypothetical protein [archaeon]